MRILTTERLFLKPIALADVNALHHLWTTPEVREFLWDGEAIPLERTASVVDESMRLFKEHGLGLWSVFSGDEDLLMGFGGFWYFHQPPELELLYGVAREYWRQGFATEIGRALVSYGFSTLNLPEIRASTDFPHHASQRVLEKLGFTFERRAWAEGLDTVFYRLPHPEK